MSPLSHDQRVQALCRLEETSSYPQARMRLEAIDRLLVLQEDFCDSDVRRIVAKRELPIPNRIEENSFAVRHAHRLGGID